MVLPWIIVLLALPPLTGHLLYRAFAPENDSLSLSEVVYLQLLLGWLLWGWLALLLAEGGWFRLPLVAGPSLLGTLVLALLRRRQVLRWRRPRGKVDRRSAAVLALLLVAAALPLLRSGERILAGNDPGVYLATAASIAQRGRIVFHDPLLPTVPVESRETLFSTYIGQHWQLGGFYITNWETGEVTPQFLHLYPAWLALFYAAGGLPALLRAVPLLVLLGLSGVFFLGRRLFGVWPAAGAVLFLALNPTLLWFSLEANAESLGLALLFGGWYLLERAADTPQRRDLGFLAGCALGLIALAKLELWLLTAPLLLLFVILHWEEGRPALKTFALTCGLFWLHGILHIAAIAYPYIQTFLTSLGNARLTFLEGKGVLLGGALLLAGLAWLLLAPSRRARVRSWAEKSPTLRIVLVVLWLSLALYGLILRPLLSSPELVVEGLRLPNYERLSFPRLSWYLSPVGLGLGIVGLAWWLGRRLDGPSLPFLGVFFLETLLYIHRTMDYPIHFWMMRRYIPVIFPCLSLGMGVALWRVRQASPGRVVRRGAAAGLLALVLFLQVQAAAPLLAQKEIVGTRAAFQELAHMTPPDCPLLIEHWGSTLAAPLRHLYGRPAYALPEPSSWEDLRALLLNWSATDYSACLLLLQRPMHLWGGLSLREIGPWELRLEGTRRELDRLPQEAETLVIRQHLFFAQAHPDDRTRLEVAFSQPEWTPACIEAEMPFPTAPLRLRMTVSGFRPEFLAETPLWVLWNGEEVTRTLLPRSGGLRPVELVLTPPPDQPLSDTLHLRICSRTWNPRAVGYNDDGRDLGILLQSLVLEEWPRPLSPDEGE